MGSGEFSVAAATAILGYDLARGTNWQQQGHPRFITRFALKGSTAAGDTKVEIFVDQTRVGEFYNSGTGFPNEDDMKKLHGNYVPPFAQIHIIVMDAPAANPINGRLEWA